MGGDNGGIHTFYGFDNAQDIRFGFEYGITDRFTAGFGRSKVMENLDFLKQELVNQQGVSVILNFCLHKENFNSLFNFVELFFSQNFNRLSCFLTIIFIIIRN